MESDGDCACGHPGSLVVDPFREEVHGESVPVVLCPACYHERVMDI